MAYLFFGYFYIKLTDTQTFLISKIEEVTTTTLMPHLQLNQDAVVRDYSETIRTANELVQKLDQSQKNYSESAESLEIVAQKLADNVRPADDKASESRELLELIHEVVVLQQQSATENSKRMGQVV